jgi:hypothetical protein
MIQKAAAADRPPIILLPSARRGVITATQECNSDCQCGHGNQCVKPAGSMRSKGVCVQPVDDFGTKVLTLPSGWRPHEVPGCTGWLDCSIGFRCEKKERGSYGTLHQEMSSLVVGVRVGFQRRARMFLSSTKRCGTTPRAAAWRDVPSVWYAQTSLSSRPQNADPLSRRRVRIPS